jgi:hypothetical protein
VPTHDQSEAQASAGNDSDHAAPSTDGRARAGDHHNKAANAAIHRMAGDDAAAHSKLDEELKADSLMQPSFMDQEKQPAHHHHKQQPSSPPIDKDPRVLAMDSFVQMEVRRRVYLCPKEDHPHLQKVLFAPGFARLAPLHQLQALDALGGKPAHTAESIAQLVDEARFRELNDLVKTATLRVMERAAGDPQARVTVTALVTAPAFGMLADDEKAKLVRYVGGTNKELSAPARSALLKLSEDPKYVAAPLSDRAAMLRRFIQDESSAPVVVEGQAREEGRARFKMDGPTEVKGYAFRSGKADALKYVADFGDQKIAIYVPKIADAKAGHIHSPVEVAKGLAALPPSSRHLEKEVVVEPHQNPEDEFWAKKYNEKDFRSYMTAGSAGQISIYPSKYEQSQATIDGSMIHETGHTLSQRRWGESFDDPRWAPWKAAMKSDSRSASKYAKNSPGEDFAETLELYHQVRGKPEAEEFREMMPERFRIIDRLLAGGK